MLVLLWGLEADSPLARVRDQLALLNVPVKFVDQRRVLETEIQFCVGKTVRGCIRMGREHIDLEEVTAVYVRSYESVSLPEIVAAGPDSHAWQHAMRVDDMLSCWSELTPALVVNRFSASAANGSKPYQLEQIRRLGWKVPDTLITTDVHEAKAFWKHHGEIVYKSISGIRSRVSRLGEVHAERFADLSSCPTQFQQYISGVDYRVHVIDDQVFACEVRCSADDYRYSESEAPEIRAFCLDPDIEEQCRKLAATMNLPLAGIDLRLTPQGEWFCFEVNPSPAFTYYEQLTGQPMSQVVAILLANAAPELTTEIMNRATANADTLNSRLCLAKD